MGAKTSKLRYSKAEKAAVNKIKEDKINKVTENVTNLQKSILKNGNSRSLITQQEQEQTNTLLNATLVAQTQLQKGGNTLSKDDMIAIFLYVRTASTGINMFERAETFKHLTRDDLVAVIRTVVYDPVEISKLIHEQMSESQPTRARADAHARYDLSDSEEQPKPIVRTVTIQERPVELSKQVTTPVTKPVTNNLLIKSEPSAFKDINIFRNKTISAELAFA
jgi:hypothetical protein